jgi:hypothetical protein
MNAISINQEISLVLTVAEAKLILSSLRALWSKLIKDKIMTPKIEEFIITTTVVLEQHISSMEFGLPELPQNTYDERQDEFKIEILSTPIL